MKCCARARFQRREVKLSFIARYCQLPRIQQPVLGLSPAGPKLTHNLSSHRVYMTYMTSDICFFWDSEGSFVLSWGFFFAMA